MRKSSRIIHNELFKSFNDTEVMNLWVCRSKIIPGKPQFVPVRVDKSPRVSALHLVSAPQDLCVLDCDRVHGGGGRPLAKKKVKSSQKNRRSAKKRAFSALNRLDTLVKAVWEEEDLMERMDTLRKSATNYVLRLSKNRLPAPPPYKGLILKPCGCYSVSRISRRTCFAHCIGLGFGAKFLKERGVWSKGWG